MSNSALYDAALSYARRGMAVLPLHCAIDGKCSCGKDDCSSPGKHPHTKTGLKEASKDPAQIADWWRKWPNANVGIVTGKVSGIVVLDIDGERGEESLSNLEADLGLLPDTWEQLTGGGGRHLVFIRPIMDKVGNRVGVAPGVDVRGDDGYIVAEPSNHVSGRQYVWEISHHPDEQRIAELPADWLDILTPAPRQYEPVELPSAFAQGERNELLFKLAASLRAKGLSDVALLAALREENTVRCKPPLPDREVETIARSAAKYQPGEIGLSRNAAARTAPLPPQEDETNALEQLKDLLQREAYYSDAVVGLVVGLERANSSLYVTALQEVRGVDGFRSGDWKSSVSAYKARQKGLTLIKGKSEPENTLDRHLQDIPLKGLVMPGDWRMSPAGQIFKYDDRGQDVTVLTACPHPVILTERLHNVDSDTEKLRIAFRRDRDWRDVVVDAATAANKASIVQLANFGLQVTSENSKLLVSYLSEFATVNQARMPLRRSTARLGWIDSSQFAPYAENVAYDGELAYQFLFRAVHSAGEYADWIKLVRPLRERSVLLRTILSASFASPLVALLGYQPFFVHLWGDSGAGKTVTQLLALSVWGDSAQLLKTLNTTMVGLERHAGFFHSLPVCLDELQSLQQRNVPIEAIVYMLSLGKGKGRGTTGGGVEIEREWHNIFLTSGETPIVQENTQGGAQNRVLEFYIDRGAYCGADPGDIAIRIGEVYGHAGRAFIQALTALRDGRQEVRDVWQELRGEIRDADYTDKHINNVAMLALGDYYSSCFIFGMDATQARAEALVLAMELLERLEKAIAMDPVRRAWDFICDWVESNKARFDPGYDGSAPRLGYLIVGEGDPDLLCVFPSVLSETLQNAGFNPAKTYRGLAEKNMLQASREGGKTRYSVRRRIDGCNIRVCAFPYPMRPYGEELQDA